VKARISTVSWTTALSVIKPSSYKAKLWKFPVSFRFVFFDTYNKILIDLDFRETVCFVVPRLPMFLSGSPRETSTVSGPQNILFPFVPVNKC
jgi:hypothetical protein